MFHTLKRDFPLIFVDLPAVDQPGACLSLVGKLDGVLLVLEAERVRSHVALQTKRLLEESHANVLGVVFNKRQNHLPGWLYRTL
jgi:Mrp family chromosome partitioning ATPase